MWCKHCQQDTPGISSADKLAHLLFEVWQRAVGAGGWRRRSVAGQFGLGGARFGRRLLAGRLSELRPVGDGTKRPPLSGASSAAATQNRPPECRVPLHRCPRLLSPRPTRRARRESGRPGGDRRSASTWRTKALRSHTGRRWPVRSGLRSSARWRWWPLPAAPCCWGGRSSILAGNFGISACRSRWPDRSACCWGWCCNRTHLAQQPLRRRQTRSRRLATAQAQADHQHVGRHPRLGRAGLLCPPGR